MKTPIFTGSGTAIVTPFRKDDVLKVDYDKFAELLDFQVAGGTSCVVVCGTTGENSTQTIDEHMATVDFAAKHIAGRIKVVAGVGSNDTMTALEIGEAAAASGVDGIMMVTPYYNKATQTGLVKHFTYVADRVSVPMIMYNVPSRTTVTISADTFKVLSSHPNINGIKEASADLTLFGTTRALVGDDLFIWSGNDDNTVPFMALGAIGVISVASNIIPAEIAQMCQFALDGDFASAAAMHHKYMDLFNKLFIEVNPQPVKTALNLMGMDIGGMRLPLCEMAPANVDKLRQSMIDAGMTVVG